MADAAVQTDEFSDQSIYVRTSRGELIKVILLAVGVGSLIPGLSWLLERFFIEPVFCRSADAFGVCAHGGAVAYYISTSLFSVVAIALMANWQVFRPLLVAVGVAASLWGFQHHVGNLATTNPLEYYLFSAAIFLATYLLFYWIMRVRIFIVSVILAIVLVIAVRLVLIS